MLPTAPTAGAPRSTKRWAVRVPARWWFPIVVSAAILLLGVAGISGSAVSLYASDGADSGLVAGTARAVRTDEYWTRTPLVVRAVELGFPSADRVGVGTHDMGVVSQLPTSGLGVVLLPYTIPYHIVGLDTAFALEWWILFLGLPALGTYALLLAFGVRASIAASAAMVMVLSPAVQWWTMPPTAAIGFATFAGAAVLCAARATTWPRRIAWSATAGWLGACLVAVLYPPWVVPIGLVVAAGCLAAIARGVPDRGDRRPWVVHLVAVGGTAAVVAGALLVLFAVRHRDAIQAISDTIYPGQRRSRAGTAPLRSLFVAPFDILEAAPRQSTVDVNGQVGFEPGGLPLLVVSVVALFAGSFRRATRPWRQRVVLLALAGAGIGLLGWYVLPLPSIVGTVTLFDRVPPVRLVLPLAVAGVLVFAVLVENLRSASLPPTRVRVAAGVGLFVVVTFAIGQWLVVDGEPVSLWVVSAIVVAFALPLGLALMGKPIGVALLALALAVAAILVNPVQHGLDVLRDSPGARLGAALRDEPGAGRVLMLSDDPGIRVIRARGGLTASGVPMVSGVNLYPDSAAWRVLDPTGVDIKAWNRFNNASWGAADAGVAPRVFLDHQDSIIVMVDPCDPRLGRLGVTTVVSLKPLDRPCLEPTNTVRDGPGTALRAYRIRRDG